MYNAKATNESIKSIEKRTVADSTRKNKTSYPYRINSFFYVRRGGINTMILKRRGFLKAIILLAACAAISVCGYVLIDRNVTEVIVLKANPSKSEVLGCLSGNELKSKERRECFKLVEKQLLSKNNGYRMILDYSKKPVQSGPVLFLFFYEDKTGYALKDSTLKKGGVEMFKGSRKEMMRFLGKQL